MSDAELSDQHCAAVKEIARVGGERVFERRPMIREHLRQRDAAPTALLQGGNSRTEVLKRLVGAVEEANAQTQRLIDKHLEAFRLRVCGPRVTSTLSSRRTKCTDRASSQSIPRGTVSWIHS